MQRTWLHLLYYIQKHILRVLSAPFIGIDVVNPMGTLWHCQRCKCRCCTRSCCCSYSCCTLHSLHFYSSWQLNNNFNFQFTFTHTNSCSSFVEQKRPRTAITILLCSRSRAFNAILLLLLCTHTVLLVCFNHSAENRETNTLFRHFLFQALPVE